jgi:hypothetical protein
MGPSDECDAAYSTIEELACHWRGIISSLEMMNGEQSSNAWLVSVSSVSYLLKDMATRLMRPVAETSTRADE